MEYGERHGRSRHYIYFFYNIDIRSRKVSQRAAISISIVILTYLRANKPLISEVKRKAKVGKLQTFIAFI